MPSVALLVIRIRSQSREVVSLRGPGNTVVSWFYLQTKALLSPPAVSGRHSLWNKALTSFCPPLLTSWSDYHSKSRSPAVGTTSFHWSSSLFFVYIFWLCPICQAVGLNFGSRSTSASHFHCFGNWGIRVAKASRNISRWEAWLCFMSQHSLGTLTSCHAFLFYWFCWLSAKQRSSPFVLLGSRNNTLPCFLTCLFRRKHIRIC